ncbi:MAG TPA: MarR family transcriptional regulator [Candidatus Acidoferrales bacterium]|nr:MarR family transcriptional regulator [Candidatus Acidoferrales bacterium]
MDASLDRLDETAAAAFGIGRTDLRAMELVSRLGTPTAGRLAGELGITTGAVTGVVDRLERAGYVERTTDASDRRKVVVRLTAKGRQREGRMFDPVLADTLRVVGGYSGAERALIADFLRRIAGITERAARRGRRPL